MEKIYVKNEDISNTITRKNLIRKFLRGKSIPTYSDEECKKLQCDGKGQDTGVTAYRSITDLYGIVLSRFPKTKFEAIIRIVNEVIEEDNSTVLVWCNMINKVVVKYYNNPGAKWISDYSKREHYTRKGVDGYSLKDYDDILNRIKNEK